MTVIMFSSALSLLLLSPLALAHPTPASTYGITTASLHTDLVDKWYSDYNTESNVTKPADPSSFYSCSGPDMNAYPSKNEWLSFKDMWEINSPEIQKKNNGADYGDAIKTAIQDVSKTSKVDSRLILAIIMQESTGGVNIPCTGGGGSDCGLMQFRGGAVFSKADPSGSIHQMISNAVFGANGKPGFLQYFAGGATDLSWIDQKYWGNPYAAAHIYNAGSISSTLLNKQEGDNLNSKSYANDIASRLLGWNGQRPGCLASVQCKGLDLRTAALC